MRFRTGMIKKQKRRNVDCTAQIFSKLRSNCVGLQLFVGKTKAKDLLSKKQFFGKRSCGPLMVKIQNVGSEVCVRFSGSACRLPCVMVCWPEFITSRASPSQHEPQVGCFLLVGGRGPICDQQRPHLDSKLAALPGWNSTA